MNSISDDIPIQANDESLSQSQLVSISEENGENGETSFSGRNNLVRSSKEILKTHKVPFPGFKKLKDKEKDKEKDKDKDNVDKQMATGKNQSSKNGNILNMDGVKENVIIAATKQLTKKDKRSSFQAASIDVSDVGHFVDKTSPMLQNKRKSSSVDVNGPTDSVQMQTFANGSSVIVEERKINETISENSSTTEKSPDSIINQQRASVVIDQNGKATTVANNNNNNNNNIQMSHI